MASYSGTFDETLIVDRSQALRAPRFNYSGTVDNFEWQDVPEPVGAFVAGGVVHTPPAPLTGLIGQIRREEGPGIDWFGKLHLIPRTPFDFGIILGLITDTFELFNAHDTAVTLTMVDDTTGVDSGVSIPDLPTPPTVLGPYVSFLDPGSTALNPLPIELVVAKEGAPSFRGAIEFVFGTGEILRLEISGTRLQLVSAIYEGDFTERLSWLTERHEALSGKGKFVSLRKNPRQIFDLLYRLDGADRQRMDALLFAAQSQPVALPLWHEDVFSTTAAAATNTSIAVVGASLVDFRIGGFAVVFESPTKFDVVSLTAVTDTLLSFSASPLTNSYSAGVRVAPVRVVVFDAMPRGARALVTLQDYRLRFVVIDNDTGAMAGSVSGWNTYGGKVLLDDCHFAFGAVPVDLEQRVHVLDSLTGSVTVSSRWPSSRRRSQRGFSLHTRSELLTLRKLLIALRGPQVSFWMPTNIEDLTAVAPLAIASQALDITHIGYTRNVQQKTGKNNIRVTFTDGTTLEREITDSEEIDATTERLTVDTGWPANRAVDEIERIEFLEPTRFDDDDFVLNYSRSGRAVLRAATVLDL